MSWYPCASIFSVVMLPYFELGDLSLVQRVTLSDIDYNFHLLMSYSSIVIS